MSTSMLLLSLAPYSHSMSTLRDLQQHQVTLELKQDTVNRQQLTGG